jgi:adenylate cyclase
VTTEIERKFLVDEPPTESVRGAGEPYRQGYLAEDGDVAVRVRITPSVAVLTVKAGRGVSRTEVEKTLTAEEAEALWVHTAGRRLTKTRHRIAVPGGVAELDLYDGPLEGLVTVEVEFDSEDAARAFQVPAWFGREVTEDGRWTNASLARHGRPT